MAKRADVRQWAMIGAKSGDGDATNVAQLTRKNAGAETVMKLTCRSRRLEWGETGRVKIPLGVISSNLRYWPRVV